MSLQALQDYTFAARYARYDANLQRRESWDEAALRMREMHQGRYPHVAAEIEAAFELVREKRVLGSQRALQFAGAPILERHAHLYNCAASYCDRLRFFQEAFWLLVCGCGVGVSVQKHHVRKLPPLTREARHTRKTHEIVDTPEGWADALGVLLSSYFATPIFAEFAGCDVRFDYANIAPAGTPMPHSNGKAPGPDALERSLDLVRCLLDTCLERGQTHLRPIDAYDLLMYISEAVLAGGIRRSAAICVFSPDDEEMLNAKTGNWFNDNPQRGRSNNSCLLLRDKTTRTQFAHILKSVREFGEPGFIWADSTEYIVNPCCEIGFYPVDETTGLSGWGLCNLTEINGAKVKSKEDFASAARAAALIGTLQAGYADFPYLGEVTERIVRRDALLGVSITGIMENPHLLLDPALQREMAELIKDTNEAMAAKIGIAPAARTTCIKPAGSSSCLLGTSSGIHPHHARRYFRRVRANKHEALLKYYAAINPQAVEDCVWSADRTDAVITFCVETPAHATIKDDLRAVEFLDIVRTTQQNWVRSGARAEHSPAWLSHNVSNTVTVRDDEWTEVGAFLFEYRADFTGVSLLPASGDKDYAQAPMCAVLTRDELDAMYGDSVDALSQLVAQGREAFAGNLWNACDALVQGNGGADLAREDWLYEASELALRSFDGDVRRLSYALKDVHHQELWDELKSCHIDVDFRYLTEEEDDTNQLMETACAGGACLI